MSSRKLDDLSPRFRPLAMELLARCVEQGINLIIVETRRTEAEHAANLAKGVSWTTHSKHIDGDAIDLCPYETYQLRGPNKLAWNDGPTFQRMGAIGKALGLRWGGDWVHVKDYGHFEWVAPATPPTAA